MFHLIGLEEWPKNRPTRSLDPGEYVKADMWIPDVFKVDQFTSSESFKFVDPIKRNLWCVTMNILEQGRFCGIRAFW